VKLLFIQSGRPNGFIQHLNRTFRQEVLNCYVFETLGKVRRITEDWQRLYNEERGHESLGNSVARQYLMGKIILTVHF
jgi:putative transposase